MCVAPGLVFPHGRSQLGCSAGCVPLPGCSRARVESAGEARDLALLRVPVSLPVTRSDIVQDGQAKMNLAFTSEHALQRLTRAQRQDQWPVSDADQQFAGAHALHAAATPIQVKGVVRCEHDGARPSEITTEVRTGTELAPLFAAQHLIERERLAELAQSVVMP